MLFSLRIRNFLNRFIFIFHKHVKENVIDSALVPLWQLLKVLSIKGQGHTLTLGEFWGSIRRTPTEGVQPVINGESVAEAKV